MAKTVSKKKEAERRKHERHHYKCRIRYQVTLEGNVSDLNIGESKNISQGGMLLNTNWPLPLMSTVALEFETSSVQPYIALKNIKNYVELEKCPTDLVRIFGQVVRCTKCPDGSYDVGVHLLNKE